jgi:uncharacterized protein YoxC
MMSAIEIFVAAAVILLAVLVGVAVPPLLQLRSTLKSMAAFLDETRPRLQAALDQATEAAGRVNRAAAGIEEGVERIRGVFDTIASIGETIETARETLRKTAAVLSAIGPALAAGFRVFWPAGGGAPAPSADPAAAQEPQASGPERTSEEAS